MEAGSDAAGNALEQALALHRQPALRFAARSRPLPDDVADLICLAAAPEPGLHDAAKSLGLADEALLEAVRFYLQQVLFEADGDAYRVLGATADASAEQLRSNYRWLQRWLHPDRRADEWESLYVTRVNGAWSQLRTPAARRAYDSARKKARRRGAVPDAVAGRANQRPKAHWQAVRVKTAPGWRGLLVRGLAACAFVGCLGLLYLALQHPPVHGLAQQAGPAPAVNQVPIPLARPSPMLARPLPQLAVPRLVPRQMRAMATLDRSAVMHDRPSPRAAAHRSPVRTSPLANRAAGRAQNGTAAVARQSDTSASAEPARATATPQATVATAVHTPERQLSPTPRELSRVNADDTVAMVLPRERKPTSADDLLQRMTQARQLLRDVLGFLQARGHDAARLAQSHARRHAVAARRNLRHRVGTARADGIVLAPAQWRFDGDLAAADAEYFVPADGKVLEHGHLRVAMVWHDSRWQVQQLALQAQP